MLWNMSMFCLFHKGLGLGIGTYPQDGKEKQRKTRQVIGWRYPQPQHAGNTAPAPCPPAIQAQCTHVCHSLPLSETVSHQSKSVTKQDKNEGCTPLFEVMKMEPFSHVSSYSSEFWTVQQEKWACGSLGGSSHFLPEMIHACQRVWKLTRREQVRTGLESGHCFSLRLWGQGAGMRKEKGQFILLGCQTGFQVEENIFYLEQWLKDLEASVKVGTYALALPSSGNRVGSLSAFLWGQANKGNLRT